MSLYEQVLKIYPEATAIDMQLLLLFRQLAPQEQATVLEAAATMQAAKQ